MDFADLSDAVELAKAYMARQRGEGVSQPA
jgi:hypothetical protein